MARYWCNHSISDPYSIYTDVLHKIACIDSPAQREMPFISFVYILASLPDCFLQLSFALLLAVDTPKDVIRHQAYTLLKSIRASNELQSHLISMSKAAFWLRAALSAGKLSWLKCVFISIKEYIFFPIKLHIHKFCRQFPNSGIIRYTVWGVCLLVAHAPKCSCACTTAKCGLWREQNSLVLLADFLTHCFCSSCSSHTGQTPRTESWSSFGLKEILTFSVSMWTTSLASGFSSHRGAPVGSFRNATIDWEREGGDEEKKKKRRVNIREAGMSHLFLSKHSCPFPPECHRHWCTAYPLNNKTHT